MIVASKPANQAITDKIVRNPVNAEIYATTFLESATFALQERPGERAIKFARLGHSVLIAHSRASAITAASATPSMAPANVKTAGVVRHAFKEMGESEC